MRLAATLRQTATEVGEIAALLPTAIESLFRCIPRSGLVQSLLCRLLFLRDFYLLQRQAFPARRLEMFFRQKTVVI
jgi:hypothetical protein